MSDKEQKTPFIADLPLNGDRYVPLLNPNNADILKSGLVTLQPGESIGAHNTSTKEEIIIFLEGDGTVWSEQNGNTPVSAGQIAFNPVQTEHNVINSGTSILRYIYVVASLITS